MPVFYILAAMVLVNLFLIRQYFIARKTNNLKAVAFYQPATSIVSLGIMGFSLFSPYFSLPVTITLAVGLLICTVADFLNIDMTQQSVVIRGLLIFLFGYLTYGLGTTILGGVSLVSIPIAIAAVALLGGILALVFKNIPAEMKLPMTIYGGVLTLMLFAAVNALFSPVFGTFGAIILGLGLIGCYISDIEFAVSTFYKPLNFPYGPYLYAGGQLLVALGVFFILL